MEIKRFDLNSIQIKGKKETVWLNPTDKMLLDAKIGGRIGIYADNQSVALGDNNVVKVAGPGEYEIGGVEITGINSGNETTLYVINVDGMIVGLLGNLKEDLSDKKVEKVAGVDILIAPINHGNSVGGKRLLELGKKWGANVLIPTGYGEGDESLKKFLDDTDFEGQESIESIKIDKDNLPEGIEVTLLKPTSN